MTLEHCLLLVKIYKKLHKKYGERLSVAWKIEDYLTSKEVEVSYRIIETFHLPDYHAFLCVAERKVDKTYCLLYQPAISQNYFKVRGLDIH